MTERVVKVYPKQEQLEHIVESLQKSYDDFDYHRMSVSSDLRKEYDLCLRNLSGQIQYIKTLYETKA
ncbi:hypothetical protein [Acinetobacter haemolyticus]|uniref:hypothetical protein n=1 Tax=Acinetobacter haemolyticus TaxID=29430 RepID=UPI0021CD3D82|nr:hypothetical protein [Acinetobacter haemolyticus]MCU4377948.1 hypothetical protein [Acinetobacter haemolyticus]